MPQYENYSISLAGIFRCTFQISAKQTSTLANFIPQSRGAKLTMSLAGKHSPTVGSVKSLLQPAFWTLAAFHAPAATRSPSKISPAEQVPHFL